MRCPSCNATNPDAATFCGLCHIRFGPAVAEPPSVSALPPVDRPVTGAPAGATRPVRASASAGRFHADGDVLGWSCGVCDTVNDLESFSCTVCGGRMDVEPGEVEARDWDGARRREALVPGLGHLRVGLVADGVARAGLAAIWLLGAVLLASGGTSGIIVAIPLVLGIGALLLTGPGDLDAARAGRRPMLSGRRFAGLVLLVTLGVAVIGALVAVL